MNGLYILTLIALLILGVFIVITPKLHIAAIVFGAFSALSSLGFLILAAPDVALAQTIIGCTISTIIFLAGIKKYQFHRSSRLQAVRKERLVRSIVALLPVGIIGGLTIYAAWDGAEVSRAVMTEVMATYLLTGAENAVTAVYLDFRILDTLLEAFLLLVSVVGISQFLILEDIEKVHMGQEVTPVATSPITVAIGRVLFLLAAIFGVYTISFGADSPGGGFQGGAVLATIVMIWYLTKRENSFHFHKLSVIEEVAFLLFLALVGGYFAWYPYMGAYREAYLLLCAILVGMKVAIGLGVIFLHFAGADEEID